MPLQLISPPGALPMDVAEARHHVRQDADFDDVKLRGLLSAANAFAITNTHRAIVASVWQLVLDTFPGPSLFGVPWGRPFGVPPHAVLLERSPLIELRGIEWLGMDDVWRTLDPVTGYVLEASGPVPRITPPFGQVWPAMVKPQIGSVRITYAAGYAAALRADVSTNRVQLINWRPLKVGDALRCSNSGGALPAPLQPDADYYVRSVAADGSVTLAATPSGTEIDLIDAGTGTHYGGTQVGTEPAGQIPEGLKAWMACRIADLYEHRGSAEALKGTFAPMPWIDSLLDPYTAPML